MFKLFPKSLGVKAFRKNCQGASYLGFYCIFINKFFENLFGRCCIIPPLYPLCASMLKNIIFLYKCPGLKSKDFKSQEKRERERERKIGKTVGMYAVKG